MADYAFIATRDVPPALWRDAYILAAHLADALGIWEPEVKFFRRAEGRGDFEGANAPGERLLGTFSPRDAKLLKGREYGMFGRTVHAIRLAADLQPHEVPEAVAHECLHARDHVYRRPVDEARARCFGRAFGRVYAGTGNLDAATLAALTALQAPEPAPRLSPAPGRGTRARTLREVK
jgi:hypothetical protein